MNRECRLTLRIARSLAYRGACMKTTRQLRLFTATLAMAIVATTTAPPPSVHAADFSTVARGAGEICSGFGNCAIVAEAQKGAYTEYSLHQRSQRLHKQHGPTLAKRSAQLVPRFSLLDLRSWSRDVIGSATQLVTDEAWV